MRKMRLNAAQIELQNKIINDIMDGYNPSAWGNWGSPRTFCSGNPNRCFVTWATGSRPGSYARYYVRENTTSVEAAELGIIVAQPVQMCPRTARTIIREKAEKAKAALFWGNRKERCS